MNAPEPLTITARLTMEWYEAYFVKRWEKTWVPSIPPPVLLDPEGVVQYSAPPAFRLITEGRWKGFEEFDPSVDEDPPVVNGFTLIKDGVWVRNRYKMRKPFGAKGDRLHESANMRCGPWRAAGVLSTVLTNKVQMHMGYISMSDYYEKVRTQY